MLVANLKQGIIYFIKQALPPNISAGSVYVYLPGPHRPLGIEINMPLVYINHKCITHLVCHNIEYAPFALMQYIGTYVYFTHS